MSIVVDVVKVACRQTKDSNYAVTFTLHPNDDSHELKDAVIGSQYCMTLVPIDADGNAQDTGEASPPVAASLVREAGAGRTPSAASRPSRNVAPGKRLIQQAALCCKDPLFQRFLAEHYDHTIASVEDAARTVRDLCHVDSRRELVLGTEAAALFDKLYGKFLVWRKAPELAAS